MSVRKVFRWMLVLALLIAAAGAWGVYWTRRHTDDLLLEGVRQHVASRVPPEWNVGIENAHLGKGGLVRLRDIHIRPQGESQDLLHIPECQLHVDLSLLLEHQELAIRRIHIDGPTLTLLRHQDGLWNWQRLAPPKESEQTPEIEITGGSVVIRTEASDTLPAAEIASHDVDMRLTPSGRRRFLIQGKSHVESAGALTFRGEADLNSKAWSLTGEAEGIDTNAGLFENAAILSPDFHRQFAELSPPDVVEAPQRIVERDNEHMSTLVRPVALAHTVTPAISQLRLPNLGFSANIGLAFALSNDGSQAIPNYRVQATIYDGQVTEPLSPVPLEGLTGRLLLENERVVVSGVRASNGESELYLSGELSRQPDASSRQFEIVATNLYLDREIRTILPPDAQRLFDLLNPSGLFTIKARFQSDGLGPPRIQLDEFAALDCQITHAAFQTPVTGITGSIRQEGDTLALNLGGWARERPVKLTGWVQGLGPAAATLINVAVDQYPVDEQFSRALVDPRQAGVKHALEALHLNGLADVRMKFARPAGVNQKFEMSLAADVLQASLNFARFPYAVNDLSGRIEFDPRKEKVWRFLRLSGNHDGAPIRGEAAFRVDQTPGQLDLVLSAERVPLDRDLFLASITANPALRNAWEELNPAGLLKLNDIRILWFPGSSPVVKLPSIQVEGGRLLLRSFPYAWDRVQADLNWDGSRIRIVEAEGWHNETHARIVGRLNDDAAFFAVQPEREMNWHLRLPELHVTNLDPGGDLPRALPAEIASVLQQLDPRGPLDLRHLGLEIKAFPQHDQPDDRITAHCSWRTQLTRDRLAAGMQLTNVSGIVDTSLKWDGEQVVGAGRIDLASASVLGMTLTDVRGPFQIDGNHVVVGTTVLLDASTAVGARPEVSRENQVTAAAYGGLVALNADAHLRPETPQQSTYRARIAFANASLAGWARELGFASGNLPGSMAGELNVYGMGDSAEQLRGDDCWVQITDARLGELPVFAQVLSQLMDPRNRDKTAFKYAYLECSIHDGLFDFGATPSARPRDSRRIQLGGDVMSLLGQGYVRFYPDLNQPMELDLYSKAEQRLPLLRMPIISQIGRVVSDNWVYVKVTGTPNQPQISTRAQVPIVNDVLRGFLHTIESGLPLPQPTMFP